MEEQFELKFLVIVLNHQKDLAVVTNRVAILVEVDLVITQEVDLVLEEVMILEIDEENQKEEEGLLIVEEEITPRSCIAM